MTATTARSFPARPLRHRGSPAPAAVAAAAAAVLASVVLLAPAGAASGIAAASGASGTSAGDVAGILRQVDRGRLDDVAPRLERPAFSAALTAADLSRGERDLLMMVFDNYEGTLLEVAGELEARRAAAGRDQFDDAIAGRVRLSPDEIAVLRRDIALADLSTWRPASRALDELFELCGLSLEGDSAGRLAAELPGLRREAFLGSLAAGESDRLEAGESVDLERLVRAAAREELAAAPAGGLETALAAWAASIDPILGPTVGEIRSARIERRVARSARDARGVADADARLIAAWRQLHGPLVRATRRIDDLARQSGGDPAAAAWRQRVREASFPWLFDAPRRPELAAAWMGRNADAASAAEARGIADAWSRDRSACDADTIALLLEAREEHDRIVHPRSDLGLLGGGRPAEIFRELLRISGRAEQIDREAEEAIAALLEPSERSRMRADLRAMTLRRGR